MAKALIALHFQNDICHRDGKVPFSLDRDAGEPLAFLEASRKVIDTAREVARNERRHVHDRHGAGQRLDDCPYPHRVRRGLLRPPTQLPAVQRGCRVWRGPARVMGRGGDGGL